MDIETELEGDSDDSEISFESSESSSCDLAASTSQQPSACLLVDPNNPEELHSFIRSKQQMIIDNLQMKPGTIFFEHVPAQFGESQLRKYFSQYGTILRVRITREKKVRVGRRAREKVHGRRVAYMEFANVRDAKKAVEAAGPINTKQFHCNFVAPEKVPLDAFHSVCDQRLNLHGSQKYPSKKASLKERVNSRDAVRQDGRKRRREHSHSHTRKKKSKRSHSVMKNI